MEAFKGKLPEKRRKDAVIAVEYMLTASPEFFEKATQSEQERFFDDALEWLREKYGHDRVLCAVVHKDETSPHLSAYVVPLTKDGRLSAKEFIGNRASMTADQTSFHQAVKHHGLERGVERSKATHQTIQQFYSGLAVNEPKIDVRLPEPGLLERNAAYGQRVADTVAKSAKSTISALEAQLTHERSLRQKAERKAKDADVTLAYFKPLLAETVKLNAVELQKFIAQAAREAAKLVQSIKASRDHERVAKIQRGAVR